MNKSKLALFALIITFLVFYTNKNKDDLIESSKRKLLTAVEYQQQCYDSNGNSILTTDYNSNSTFSAYLSNRTYPNEQAAAELKAVLFDGASLNAGSTIVPIIAPFIIFFVFFVILFFSWVPYCICCCCPCCCCKSTPEHESGGCKTVSLVFMIIFSVIVVACCIYGFVTNASIPLNFDKTECVFSKFVIEFKSGENKTTLPRWIGVDGISVKLTNLSDSIDEIVRNSDTAFNSQRKQIPRSAANDYQRLLENGYAESLARTTTSPGLDQSNKILPGYVEVSINILI